MNIQKQNLSVLLSEHKTHALEDLSNAKLMSRVDRKFLMPKARLNDLFARLNPMCTVLKINNSVSSTYKNTYYDTAKLDFYQQHHNGKLNRLKIRTRCYADQQQTYLETKLKTNKGRTVKKRIPIQTYSNDQLQALLDRSNIEFKDDVSASQNCNYERVSFAREDCAERLTVDTDLEFIDVLTQQKVSLPDLVIVELKQDKYSNSSAFSHIIKSLSLHSTKFSKYCIGTALLKGREIKSNRFKSTLLQLQKIAEENLHA